MSSKARPPVLTLLAIANFIFAAMFGIGLASYLWRFRFVQMIEAHVATLTEAEQQQGQAILHIGATAYYMLGIWIMIVAVLLIVSGIGYLFLKRFEGRTLGNVAVSLAIAAGLAVLLWLPRVLDGGINGFSAINLTYPLLTLFLLNKTFKDYFVN
jgi:predicted small integral membrane protein